MMRDPECGYCLEPLSKHLSDDYATMPCYGWALAMKRLAVMEPLAQLYILTAGGWITDRIAHQYAHKCREGELPIEWVRRMGCFQFGGDRTYETALEVWAEIEKATPP